MKQISPELDHLLSAAKSPDEHIRREAIIELVHCGDESGGELLMEYINGDDVNLKSVVAHALLEINLTSGLARTLSKSLWFSIAVNQLVFTYRAHPQGFVRGENSPEEIKIRRIGFAINNEAGVGLMLAAHKEFTKLNEVYGAPRNLEILWDGIGDWQG